MDLNYCIENKSMQENGKNCLMPINDETPTVTAKLRTLCFAFLYDSQDLLLGFIVSAETLSKRANALLPASSSDGIIWKYCFAKPSVATGNCPTSIARKVL